MAFNAFRLRFQFAAAALATSLIAIPADAQDVAGTDMPSPAIRGVPPYETGLLRLSEILGSVQYLRKLCGQADESGWRKTMQALLDSETAGEPARREKLTAGYNRGYRAFAAVYNDCSASAVAAETRYRREGATLAEEIVARYGN